MSFTHATDQKPELSKVPTNVSKPFTMAGRLALNPNSFQHSNHCRGVEASDGTSVMDDVQTVMNNARPRKEMLSVGISHSDHSFCVLFSIPGSHSSHSYCLLFVLFSIPCCLASLTVCGNPLVYLLYQWPARC